MDLFDKQRQSHLAEAAPLALRMRPITLDEFAGQQHLIGPGKILRRMIEADRVGSVVFHGPPGTGKTTLAGIIAKVTQAHFSQVNASCSTVKEVRELLQQARDRLETAGQRTVLFVDELHRFNRAQQDVLLRDVEEGIVTLIGATTENPFFTVNTPLVSRSQLMPLEPLSVDDLCTLMQRAMTDVDRGLGKYQLELTQEAAQCLAKKADGDARRALTALEIAALSLVGDTSKSASLVIDETVARESILQKAIRYDAAGDMHYDSISAMIKSIRGGDPDAAIYWLAQMLVGGEDPRFVARRVVISAAEDIGHADPQGLILAQAAANATQLVGMPECQIPLAQAVIYLACAPKSRACYLAIAAAMEDVRTGVTVVVPEHLRTSVPKHKKNLLNTQANRYSKDSKGDIVKQAEFGVQKSYYVPTAQGAEAKLKKYVDELRSQRVG